MNTQPLDKGIYTSCTHCKKKVDTSETFCSHCGFPQQGTSEQKKKYYAKAKVLDKQLAKNKARIYIIVAILVLIAGFNGFYGILMLFHANLFGVFMIVLGSMFGGFAYWCLKKPLPAISTAIVLFVLNAIVVMLLEQRFEFTFGLGLKIFIILVLANGIFSARKIKKIEAELKSRDI